MKTVMVVDDDKLSLNSVMKILSDSYKVVLMTSGEMALSYLSKNIPDLILLDIQMPNMDGFEVMKAIRANPVWADIPVIFLTADVSPQTCTKGGGLGVAGFMAKPLEAERMISGVEAVIGK